MKLCMLLVTLILSTNLFADSNVIRGSTARSIIFLLAYEEDRCDQGRCEVLGEVRCQRSNLSGKTVCSSDTGDLMNSISGTAASRVFDFLESTEGDCGAGHCWAVGNVTCKNSKVVRRAECRKHN